MQASATLVATNAMRLGRAELIFHVVREVTERVALALSLLVRNVFVATGEAHRLEAHDRDLVGVLDREVDDRADLIVVYAADDRDDEHDVDPDRVEIFDRRLLHVEEVSDLAVRVRLVGDAVELEVREPEAGLFGRAAELSVLRETNSVRRALDAEISDLARIRDGS